MKNDFWFDDDFFNQTFPILNEEWKITFVPQVIIESWDKNYVYLLNILKETYENRDIDNAKRRRFDRIKNIITSVPNNNISIFWFDEESHDSWIELLKLYKEDFSITKSKKASTEHLREEWTQIRQTWRIKIKEENLRLIIKIMFNYFAYCVSKDDEIDILYLGNFDRIRGLVLWNKEIEIWVDIQITNDRVIKEEQDREKFYIWHQILFEIDWDDIIWKLTLFWITFYRVTIWSKYWVVEDEVSFGCWHYFNIPNERVHSLVKNPALIWENENELWFWLYKKWF